MSSRLLDGMNAESARGVTTGNSPCSFRWQLLRKWGFLWSPEDCLAAATPPSGAQPVVRHADHAGHRGTTMRRELNKRVFSDTGLHFTRQFPLPHPKQVPAYKHEDYLPKPLEADGGSSLLAEGALISSLISATVFTLTTWGQEWIEGRSGATKWGQGAG